jgi:hypothetical protein
MAGSHHSQHGRSLLLGVSVLCVFVLESAHAFFPKPLLLSATRPSDLRISTRILNPLLTTKMAGVSTLDLRTNSDRGIGPHIRIGKKGAILNFWGFWVMFYSVFIALFGYAYLKLRIILGILTLGLLKPKAEHCCWIMHAWCKLVLWLGWSNPEVRCPPAPTHPPAAIELPCQVQGLENLPPKGETILVAANHMSWFDVPVLSGYLGDRKLWSFAKGALPYTSMSPRTRAAALYHALTSMSNFSESGASLTQGAAGIGLQQ